MKPRVEGGSASSEEPADEQLVDRVLQGDVSAYDPLVVRYQTRLYSVIYNMTSNHEDTNDLLMVVFDRAFRNLSSYKKTASFSTWIHRIAINQTLNFIKSRKKHGYSLSLNDIEGSDLDPALDAELSKLGVPAGPEREVGLGELQKKLNESLQKLSEDHRTVVVLSDVEGVPQVEIAKILNISEGTVRSRLHYAHQQLRKMLGNYLKD